MKERQDEEQRVKDAELARIAELEKPAPDELYGMRVHCWVLVLAGKREVLDRFILTFSVLSKKQNYGFKIVCMMLNMIDSLNI